MRVIQSAVLSICLIVIAGCGNSFSGAQKYFTGPVNGVGLKKTTSIIEGGVEQLYAVVTPSKTSNKKVIWSSSDSSIASIDSVGTVTAVKVGSAVITAVTDEGGYTASCDVTVAVKPIPITSLTLNKNASSILIGNTEQLTASISPVTATNQNLTWTSDDDGIVAVDQTGLVTGKTAGKTVVRVTSSDGGFKASCTFTSTSAPVYITNLAINKSSTYIQAGKSETLFGLISPSDATNQVLTWSSSDTGIATVGTNSGIVTAVAAGTAVITASSNYTSNSPIPSTLSASSTVTVVDTAVSVDSVSLSKTSVVISVGATSQLTALISPSNATDQSLLWSSSKSSVASVDSSGVVTGVSSGGAVITVTTVDGSKTASCSVIVNAAKVAVTGVTLNKSSTSIQAGKTETLFATVDPVLASDVSVTWSTSNSAAATVSSGTVTGIKAGTATITVTTTDGAKTASCDCTITAAPIPLTAITLSPLTVKKGSSVKCTPVFTPADATNQSLTWTSSNTSVATVDSSGIVAGVEGGTSVITATAADGSGISQTCTATVTIPVASVGISKISSTGSIITAASVSGGSTLQLYAVLTPSAPTNSAVTWTSMNTSVATVSTAGVVTPVSPGKASIRVTTSDGGYTAYCVVTVNGCTLTYNANGGTGDTPDSVSQLSGGTIALSGNTGSLAKTGYMFAGWIISSNVYRAAATYTISSDMTAHAKWSPIPVFATGGDSHSVIVANDGTVWTSGYNGSGRLGDGTTSTRSTWVQVMADSTTPFTGAVKAYASEKHTMIIKTDGTVWAMGQNESEAGQLCNGTTSNSSYPVQSSITGVSFISSRTCQNLFVKTSNELWGGGKNAYGELGQEATKYFSIPVQLMTGSFISAAAGRMHSVVVSDTGAVYSTGQNDDGELGSGTSTSTSSFSLVFSSGATSVAAGFYHTLVLSGGAVYAAGANSSGQLGNGTTTNQSSFLKTVNSGVVSIACGNMYSMYINSSGELYATGANYNGQFGNGTTSSVNSWAKVMSGVASVFPGNDFTFIFKTDGTLWATGNNYYGQLGNGTSSNSYSTPFQVFLP